MSHTFDPTIIRAYDIRGIVGETLHPRDAWAIGRVFGNLCGQDVIVGMDGRHSSPQLAENLIKGLTEAGVHVKNIGICATPEVYYTQQALSARGAIMITGSHNPPQHNGLKFVLDSAPFYGKDLEELARTAQHHFPEAAKHPGSHEKIPTTYLKSLISEAGRIADSSKLKIAWDPGNGATGDTIQQLLSHLPGEHILINGTIDGDFPAHHPDPSKPENMQQLSDLVKSQACDLGIAFDGDGDRVGFIDDNGQMLFGDQTLAFLAADVLQHNPNAEILFDCKCSQNTIQDIVDNGGKPVMLASGHSNIKTHLKKCGAPFAGEYSGHFFFADRAPGYDDGIYTALRFIQSLIAFGKPLSQWLQSRPAIFNTPELSYPTADERKSAVIEQVKQNLTSDSIAYNDIDGVRVSYDHGWWLLRPSNTQAVLTARVEANSKENLLSLQQELDHYLHNVL
ncbi:MAG: phosphomannomutase/phosphoglucomutase [Alphaproteobacteria bacterium]